MENNIRHALILFRGMLLTQEEVNNIRESEK